MGIKTTGMVAGFLLSGLLVAGCAATPGGREPAGCACAAAEGVAGRWTFDLYGACWMGIVKNPDGTYSSSILWGGSSPVRQDAAVWENGVLTMRQKYGAGVRVTTAALKGEALALTVRTFDRNGKLVGEKKGAGKRIPALPPAPDLVKIRYAAPVDLLAQGRKGWQIQEKKNGLDGWSFKDGVLSNRITRDKNGKTTYRNMNIQTVRRDFTDFKIAYDVRVLPACNSGVYLRGIYELQVLDSYGRPVDSHNMAALYGRITPRVAAEKPANEWQHVEAILCDRHITVTLNGVNIIDNQPILGVTGGAITADEFVPGPIYLQGDHSDADFRNMILTPIVR